MINHVTSCLPSCVTSCATSCMDQATSFLWGAYIPACSFEDLSSYECLVRCVHCTATAVFALVTVGTLHAATFFYLSYRIRATDLTNTPLHQPALLRVAMYLHAGRCTEFAQKFSQAANKTLPQEMLMMRILNPQDLPRFHLKELTKRFLDQADTRPFFEKYQSFVQEYGPRRGENGLPSDKTLQSFAKTLLAQLVLQNGPDTPNSNPNYPHPLFKKNLHGYHLSFDSASPPSEDTLQLCREVGTLLGAWVSDSKLAQYSLGSLFSLDVYVSLLWFIEFQLQDLALSYDELLKKRTYTLYALLKQGNPGIADFSQRCPPIKEVAQAFKAVYKGGVEEMIRGDYPSAWGSACLVATLLQGEVYDLKNSIKLLEVAAAIEGVPSEIIRKCEALRYEFKHHPESVRAFLVTLNRVELASLSPDSNREPMARYGQATLLIRAIEEHPVTPLEEGMIVWSEKPEEVENHHEAAEALEVSEGLVII